VPQNWLAACSLLWNHFRSALNRCAGWHPLLNGPNLDKIVKEHGYKKVRRGKLDCMIATVSKQFADHFSPFSQLLGAVLSWCCVECGYVTSTFNFLHCVRICRSCVDDAKFGIK
jgi:hypothetical protein